MTISRSPRDKYSHDPLVPIIPARLNAALGRRKLSVKAAAERIGMSQQTLDAIIQSAGPRRCRQSTLNKLASLVAYPEDWLSGRADWLPDTVWTAQSQEPGHPYLMDGSFLFRRNPDGTPELPWQQGLNPDPPAYQLAGWHLSERIIEAWKRDLSIGNEDAARAWDGLRRYDLFSEDGMHVRHAVQKLLALASWGKLFMLRRGPPLVVRLPPPDDLEPAEVSEARRRVVEELSCIDSFAVAMSNAIEVLLEPWLSASMPLNYDTVTEVMTWVLGGMMSQHKREQFEELRRRHKSGS